MKKKSKKRLPANKLRRRDRVRLEGVVADLRKTRYDLKDKIRRQTGELKVKNGQLKDGARKEIRLDLEIERQRDELLHVTRVGKLAEFVSSLAHEISQPLTAILSYAQAARRMLRDREPEVQKIISYIIDDDQRAASVIQRLRVLLKKGKPEMKLLDINDLINDTVVLIATDAHVRNISLKFEWGAGLPLVCGDRIQLQQVILNLISNSFDAMENSPKHREISIRTSRKDTKTLIVAVKDSGCGIPKQNIPKLFTHFFTSKADGLGMGLSISRSIIEAHGGRLDVKNNPDRGATFYFTLPVGAKEAL
jgi:two-component system, LuxR family, sensor kinase FixL